MKWTTIWLLLVAELLSMGVWFSASAVAPALSAAWSLDDSGRAWLTMSVQAGFVAGALLSALLNLADRIPAHLFFAWSAIAASASTAMIAARAEGLALAVALRFLTGFFLAGVYPVGMKIVATWTYKDRGLGIGLLVGALTRARFRMPSDQFCNPHAWRYHRAGDRTRTRRRSHGSVWRGAMGLWE